MDVAVSMAQIYVLGVARVAGFIILVPILGTSAVPTLIKAALALCLGAFLFHWNAAWVGTHALGWFAFTLLLFKETLVGLLMGLTLFLLLATLQAVGELVGFQMMFSAATTFSMLNLEQNTVTGNLFNILAMLIFVAIDGHHALISALDLSFQVLPVLMTPTSFGPPHAWFKLLGRIFEVSFKLSLPLMAALFISNIILGIIARTMPQINVFVIGLPVQIVAGFAVLLMMLTGIISNETGLFHQWAYELKGLVLIFKP